LSNPKKHHFVPQWYLKQFVDHDGHLNLYDKVNGLWRRQKPKEVMHRNKYYHQGWAPEGVDENILEKTLGNHIEPRGKDAIEKILAWDEDITSREWADFVIYMTFQTLRIPKRAELAKELLRSHVLINGDPEVSKLVFEGKVLLKINDSFRFDFMKMASTNLYRYFLRMDWEIVVPEDSEFVTSDCPVTFFNPEIDPRLEAGLGLVGTVVLFPLRPDRLLLMRHPEALIEGCNLLSVVPEYNREEGGNRISQRISWPKEQVIRHNKLIVEYSQRLVVASSKEILEQAVGHLDGN
jgi:hypothetical protein